MNIFRIEQTPEACAHSMLDSHVVKMCVETPQLLSGAHHMLDGNEAIEGIYKLTHKNHPCAIWTRASNNNYTWLYCHFKALCDEYTYRYGKVHACERLLPILYKHPKNIPVGYLTPMSQCMPDEYKRPNTVDAYRAYYIGAKSHIAKWNKARPAPDWWPNKI